jgi:hypothetical protein
MSNASIRWEHDFPAALDRARRERRFILADFSKDH